MRVMLGKGNEPTLLVEVERGNFPEEFQFWVVNGAWEGSFDNGSVVVANWFGHSRIDGITILSDNQDRLRGEYQDVFQNWDNPDYVAPKPEPLPANYWDGFDDDIPF